MKLLYRLDYRETWFHSLCSQIQEKSTQPCCLLIFFYFNSRINVVDHRMFQLLISLTRSKVCKTCCVLRMLSVSVSVLRLSKFNSVSTMISPVTDSNTKTSCRELHLDKVESRADFSRVKGRKTDRDLSSSGSDDISLISLVMDTCLPYLHESSLPGGSTPSMYFSFCRFREKPSCGCDVSAGR